MTRRDTSRARLGASVAAALVGIAALALVSHGDAAIVPSSTVRGVALGLFATDPEWDYGPMIRELRARGATDVLVVVQLSQHDRFESDLARRSGHAPSEATLVRTLRQARASGLRVGVMPIVHLLHREPHEWRGTLVPADGLDTWFARYAEEVLALATIAEREHVSRFVIGSELSSLERYEERWRALAVETRTRFSGTLTYSANWDRLDDVPFWDAVDEIGLTAYFPLAAEGEPVSEASIAQAWRDPREAIAALSRRHDRPVVLTELGYPSRTSAAHAPWDDGPATHVEVDLEVQGTLLAGFCDAFADRGVIDGFYAWNWFGVGGGRDTSFTLRGKPAAQTLERCFERRWEERR